VFTRTPSLLAQAAATLDQLADGRAVLGLGTGHEPALVAGHGVHFERPLARMREYVTIIKAILRGEAEMPACYVRVAAGASNDEMRRALAWEVGRYVNMPFYRAMFDEAGFAAHTGPVAAAYSEDVDRAARLVPDGMLEALTVAGDVEAARARLERYRGMGVKLPVVAPVPSGPDIAASWQAAIEITSDA
jgi:alkanesulfonate monooxygenase SsuD/methylene tetrahydromethanopterin reductase-like flavin-dependent oxidoreductase (luciferase family)